MKLIVPDEGYYFGIGAFETIAVEQGRPMFLERHYARLMRASGFLQLMVSMEEVQREVDRCLKKDTMKHGRKVIKVTASRRNLLVETRENPYRAENYQRGFVTKISHVRRNETSPFTYHKTLNYGDCIYEKRNSKAKKVDEPVFLNTKGVFAEGASANLFFVKEGKIFTPSVSCGLLPGIMRSYVCEAYSVEERAIYPEDLENYEEMFLTNSLMGVMPVRCIGAHVFPSMKMGRRLWGEYRKLCARDSCF